MSSPEVAALARKIYDLEQQARKSANGARLERASVYVGGVDVDVPSTLLAAAVDLPARLTTLETVPGGSYTLTTTGGQSIPSPNPAIVELNAQRELAGMTWDGTNRRFVIARAGRYLINGAVMFKPGATTGRIECHLMVNETRQANDVQPFPSAAQYASAAATMTYRLAVGDTVAMAAGNNSGTSQTLHEDTGCWLDVTWLGP